MLSRFIEFFLEKKLFTMLLAGILILWGTINAPFIWELGLFPRDPVPVDAIPDIGENQQIVFTEWMGPFSTRCGGSGHLSLNYCTAGNSWSKEYPQQLHIRVIQHLPNFLMRKLNFTGVDHEFWKN